MEWIIGGIVLLVILGAIFKPSSCDVCGTGFKKKYYTWTIEGKKQHLDQREHLNRNLRFSLIDSVKTVNSDAKSTHALMQATTDTALE